MTFRHIAIGFMLLLSPGLAAAAALHGRVLAADSKQPLPGASVVLLGTRFGAMADSLGRFSIDGLSMGNYSAQATLIGFQAKSELVILSADTAKRWIDFLLSPTAVQGEEVIVTSSRYQQLRTSTPATVNVIDSTMLARLDAPTFDHVLEQVPGVLMTRSGPVTLGSLSLRGASDSRGGGVGNRVLLLLDGRPMLTADAGGGNWALIPQDAIRRVEIVKGTASALYGGYAMGGVVNVITRDPSPVPILDVHTEGGWFETPPAWMRFDHKQKYLGSAGAAFSNTWGSVGILATAAIDHADDYKQNSDYTLGNAYLKAVWNIESTQQLTAALMAGQAGNGYPATWIDAAHPLEIEPRSQDNRQFRGWINADLVHHWQISPTWELSSHVFSFYNDLDNTYNPDSTRQLPNNQSFGLESRSISNKLGLLWQAVHHFSGEHWGTFGADWQVDRVNAWPDTLLYGRHQVNYLGVYGEYQVNLIHWANLTLGAREDFWKEVGKSGKEDFNPKAGLVLHPSDGTAIRMSFGQAFRYPTIAEFYLRQNATYDLKFRYNPNLGPEKITASGEIGINQRLGGWGFVDLAFFYNRYRDMIYWATQPEGDVMPVNLSQADIRGFETELNLARDFWRFAGGVAYLNGQDNSPLDTFNLSDLGQNALGSILLYKPEWTINFTISADLAELKTYNSIGWLGVPVTVTLAGRWVSKTDRVFFYQTDAPGAHFTMDANLEYIGIEGVAIRLGGRNLTNAQYEELERYRLPGRTWTLGLAVHLGGK